MKKPVDRLNLWINLGKTAYRLEQRAKMIRDVLDHTRLSLPRGYKGNKESYNKLVANNERLGFNEVETREAFDRLNTGRTLHRMEFARHAKKLALYDPVAQHIHYQIETNGSRRYTKELEGEQLTKMQFTDKMLTRTIAAEEYDVAQSVTSRVYV